MRGIQAPFHFKVYFSHKRQILYSLLQVEILVKFLIKLYMNVLQFYAREIIWLLVQIKLFYNNETILLLIPSREYIN